MLFLLSPYKYYQIHTQRNCRGSSDPLSTLHVKSTMPAVQKQQGIEERGLPPAASIHACGHVRLTTGVEWILEAHHKMCPIILQLHFKVCIQLLNTHMHTHAVLFIYTHDCYNCMSLSLYSLYNSNQNPFTEYNTSSLSCFTWRIGIIMVPTSQYYYEDSRKGTCKSLRTTSDTW